MIAPLYDLPPLTVIIGIALLLSTVAMLLMGMVADLEKLEDQSINNICEYCGQPLSQDNTCQACGATGRAADNG